MRSISPESAYPGSALRLAANGVPWDTYILDIGLPDFKGYDIAKQLRWEPGLARAAEDHAARAGSHVDVEVEVHLGGAQQHRSPINPHRLLLVQSLLCVAFQPGDGHFSPAWRMGRAAAQRTRVAASNSARMPGPILTIRSAGG